MAAKVFITGVTGYVGGTVLDDLTKSNPSLALTVLVRTEAQATKINEAYPEVKVVIGDFDSHDLMVSTASESDVVLHIAGDFEPAKTAIFSLLEGVGQRPTGRKFFIHISGSSTLIDPNYPPDRKARKRYSDVSDYEEIMNLSRDRPHVTLERQIVEIGTEKDIKTTILAPPYIYGEGRGTCSRTTYSFEYARQVLKRGKGFLLGKGHNSWSVSSVGDVSSAIIFVLEEVLKELEKEGAGKVEYGPKGYYFIESGAESTTRDRANTVLKYLKEQGAIDSIEIETLGPKDIIKMFPTAMFIFGSSSRSKADRLRALGWEPKDDWREKLEESTKVVLEEFRASKAG